MRNIVCCLAWVVTAAGAAVSAGEEVDAKDWQVTRAIVTTRSAVTLQTRDGEVPVIFPVVTSFQSKDDQVYVQTLSGHFGWMDKNKLVSQRRAVELFGDRIKTNPGEADAYYRRGLARFANQDQDGAVNDLNEAIRLDPKEAAFYVARGMMRMTANDAGETATDLAVAGRLSPTDPAARFFQAKAFHAKKMTKEAVDACGEAIRLMPTFLSAYELRAALWEAQGQFDRSLADHDELVRLDPTHGGRYLDRGRIKAAKKDADGALKDYDRAVERSPNSELPFNYRAILLYQQKKYERAMADFAEVARLNPKNALAINNHAWILATCPDDRLRDGAKALDLAKAACELDGWKHPMMLGTLAAAHAEVGRFDEAVNWQQKALDVVEDAKKADFQASLDLYRSRKPKRD